MNILNRPWNESFGLPRFDTIQEENFLPALKEAIYFARQNLKSISSEPDRPSFKNTIETFEKFDEMLSRLTALFFNLVNANSNYKLEEIQLDFVKRVSELYS